MHYYCGCGSVIHLNDDFFFPQLCLNESSIEKIYSVFVKGFLKPIWTPVKPITGTNTGDVIVMCCSICVHSVVQYL